MLGQPRGKVCRFEMRWGRNLWSVRVALKARGLKHSEVAPGVEASQAAPPAAGDWKGKGGSWAAAREVAEEKPQEEEEAEKVLSVPSSICSSSASMGTNGEPSGEPARRGSHASGLPTAGAAPAGESSMLKHRCCATRSSSSIFVKSRKRGACAGGDRISVRV